MATAIVLASAVLLATVAANTLANVVGEPDIDRRRSLCKGFAVIAPFAAGLFWVAWRLNF